MERIIVVLENRRGLKFGDARRLLERLRSMGIRANDLRVDVDHLEVDAEGSPEAISKELGERIVEVRPVEGATDARRLLCSGRFWEAHEALEEPWRGLKGDEAEGYRKAILFCAAMIHMQRGDAEGFRRILERALAIAQRAFLVEGCLQEAARALSKGPEEAYVKARSLCSSLCGDELP